MSNVRDFTTSKGTPLPLLNLRGREYLEVKYRIVWFREEHPNWAIETELLQVTDKSAYAKATIRNDQGGVMATSHKFEDSTGFPDFIEKAETGAIGRALALVGYGTQFCADELDEGKRLVDTPVQVRKETTASKPAPAKAEVAMQELPPPLESPEDNIVEDRTAFIPGDFQINFGKKYKGRRLKDIPQGELESYVTWLENTATQEGKPISHQVQYLRKAFDLLVSERNFDQRITDGQ